MVSLFCLKPPVRRHHPTLEAKQQQQGHYLSYVDSLVVQPSHFYWDLPVLPGSMGTPIFPPGLSTEHLWSVLRRDWVAYHGNIWGSKHFPPGAIQSYGLSGCIWAWGYNDSISSSSLCAGALPHVCYEKLPAVWRARQYNKLHININEPLSLLWEKVNVITMLYSANKCLRQFF